MYLFEEGLRLSGEHGEGEVGADEEGREGGSRNPEDRKEEKQFIKEQGGEFGEEKPEGKDGKGREAVRGDKLTEDQEDALILIFNTCAMNNFSTILFNNGFIDCRYELLFIRLFINNMSQF